jgi:prevent-host-death family protein
MFHTITATKAKNNFGEVIKQVYAAGEQIIVEKSGIPVVVIIPITDYERLPRESDNMDAKLRGRVGNASRTIQANWKLRKYRPVDDKNNGKGYRKGGS